MTSTSTETGWEWKALAKGAEVRRADEGDVGALGVGPAVLGEGLSGGQQRSHAFWSGEGSQLRGYDAVPRVGIPGYSEQIDWLAVHAWE